MMLTFAINLNILLIMIMSLQFSIIYLLSMGATGTWKSCGSPLSWLPPQSLQLKTQKQLNLFNQILLYYREIID